MLPLRRLVPILCVLALVPGQAIVAEASHVTIYVDASATGDDDGSSWTDAYPHLQQAFAALTGGEEVWIAQGTYYPDYDPGSGTRTGDISDSFELRGLTPVELYGGFPAGGGDGTFGARDPSNHVTRLSGDLAGDDDDAFSNVADNARYVVLAHTGGPHVIDGVTISGGHAVDVPDGAFPRGYGRGGGVHATEVEMTVRDTILERNAAANGGGIWVNDPTTVEDVTFTGNSAEKGGGLMMQSSEALTVVGSTFTDNVGRPWADPFNTSAGGAVWMYTGSIRDSHFEGNTADSAGALFLVVDGPIEVTSSTVIGNDADIGGGIYINSIDVGSVDIVNTLVAGNEATDRGGGLYLSGSTDAAVTVANSLFTNNTADQGGAIQEDNSAASNLDIVNSTLYGNTALTDTGGVWSRGGAVWIANSILWGNTGGDLGGDVEPGDLPTVSHSIVEGGATGTNVITDDPLLVDPDGADDVLGTIDDDPTIDLTSPAVDAGANAEVPADVADLDGDADTAEQVPLDFRGTNRFIDVPAIDDTGSGTAPLVDIGAVEVPRWALVDAPDLPEPATATRIWTGEPGVVHALLQRDTTAYVMRWDGSWSIESSHAGLRPDALFGTGPDDVYASLYDPTAAEDATLRHYDGTAWTSDTSAPSAERIRSISGSPDDIQIGTWTTVGPTSYVHRNTGSGWTEVYDKDDHATYYTPDSLTYNVSSQLMTHIGADEAYIASCWGHGWWTAPDGWTAKSEFDFCDVYDMWGARDDSDGLHLWTIGNNNDSNGVRIWSYDEVSRSFGSKLGYEFADGAGDGAGSGTGIWGSDWDDVYATGRLGDGGRIYHNDGTGWRSLTAAGTIDAPVVDVWGTGPDDVWFLLRDGRLLHLTGDQHPPGATDDDHETAEDTTLTVSTPGVLGNDGDPDGDAITAELVDTTSEGQLTLDADGSFTYVPNDDWSGSDTFTYRATDGALTSDAALVTITVTPVNDVPTAGDDAYVTAEDTRLTVPAPGLLANDSDPDNQLSVGQATTPAHGLLNYEFDGSFTYTPFDNWFGADSFTYRAYDGDNYSTPATVTITVTPVNDPPTAGDDDGPFIIPGGTSCVDAGASLLILSDDADGDALTTHLYEDADHLDVTLHKDGTWCAEADGPWPGTDTFRWRAWDGTAWSNVATVSLSTNPDNQVADLTLTKTADRATVDVGQVLTYTLRVHNAGPDVATGVAVHDGLPANVQFHSASTNCTETNSTVVCDLGTIAVGRTASVQIRVTPTGSGQIINGAHLGYPGYDPDGDPGISVTVRSLLPDPGFGDTGGTTFEDDIAWMWAMGITKGCNPPANTDYCPDAYVTRGQMAAFLVRALGYTNGVGANLFTDDNTSIFENDIDRLATAEVTKGCNPPSNTHYCPDDYVTRGQMAAFLVRALGYTAGAGANLFTDDNTSIFENDIDRLATAEVTKGCNPPSNTHYCPDDYVTRGQMAAFLHRALS